MRCSVVFNQNPGGFTLIEVLIALAILSISLIAVTLVVEQSIYDNQHVSDKLAAHWVAMNVIAELQVNVLHLPEGKMKVKGNSNMLGKQLQWSAGYDQQQDDYYQRIYVDVESRDGKKLAHLIGFLKR